MKPSRRNKPMTIEAVTSNIIHISLPTQRELASTMMRFQEYYESPIENIKGHVFTVGMLKHESALSRRSGYGANTYCDGELYEGDWNGFNFPSWVLQPFIQGLFDPLTPGEQDLVELFRYRMDAFYVIGTHTESEDDPDLDHETCHGLYYTVPRYRKAVDSTLDSHRGSKWRKGFDRMLRAWGYCKEVLQDETHAYMSADYVWLNKNCTDDLRKYGIDPPEAVHKKLRSVKKRYFQG